ncbi:MAG TPA: ATP-binding protein [Anaerolineales bacterium]|jgi:signal transduction histidine kinase|nr:ATP-binding protein [Anaerolineales bacterium]
MTRFSWRGLTPQLFLIVILPLTALLLAIAFGGLYLHRQAMRRLVGERDERAARAAASALREQLNHRTAAIHGLALRAGPNTSPGGLSAILRESDFLLHDFDGGMGFLTPTGEVLASTGDPDFWNASAFKTLPELKSIFSQGSPPAFLAFPDPKSGDTVMLATALPPQGSVIAVGAFSASGVAHDALDNMLNPGGGAVAFVVDKQFHLLYQMGTLLPNTDLQAHPGVSQALDGKSGATFAQIGGAENVVAYSPVSPVGWALVIEEPWEAVASPLLRTTEYAPLVLIPVLLLSLVALWFGTRRIVQPLQTLETKAAQLGWGDFEAIEDPVGGTAEIRHLQRELIHMAQKLKSAQQGLRGYIGAITMGQEEERRRLARELHDDTLQSLIALNQRVQLARLSLDRSPEAGSLAEIQGLTEETIQNLRRLTRALRPIYLEDLGLAASLEMLAKETEHNGDLSIDFHRIGTQRRLSPASELALYRIAQEAISNVLRHAGASKARLQIAFCPEQVLLEITDDGQGFEVPESPSEFAPSGHFGLLGMHERAELIGARLEIRSTPGQGAHLTVALPLDAAKDNQYPEQRKES